VQDVISCDADIKLKKSGFFQVHLSKELHAFGMCWQFHYKIPIIQ
jgi:hypothetical protein